MMVDLLLATIAMLLLSSTSAEYDVNKYCKLVTTGTKLPSMDSCQLYYSCNGNDMVGKQFCPANTVFDRDAQSCVPEAQSNCFYGLANPCHNKHNQFTYCSNGCNWYNWCVNGQIAGNGTCSVGQKFYVTNSTCIYGECETNSQSDIQDMCDIMPEGEFFGDFENCRAWHKCVAMNQLSGVCEDSLVYDVVTGRCLTNEGNMCQRTNNMVQGQAAGPPVDPCTDLSQVVGDPNVCYLYYICVIATQNPVVTYRWKQKSCNTQYFDVISKTCSDTLMARPYPGCDRCELKTGYARTYWTNGVDPNCEQYFTCQNGRKLGTGLRSCKNDYFFDEGAQACVGSEERLEQYITTNGACQHYTCTQARECSLAGTGEGGNIVQPPVNNTTAPKETPNATANKTPNEKPNETPNATPNEKPNETPNATPNEKPNETPNATPNEKPNETPNAR